MSPFPLRSKIEVYTISENNKVLVKMYSLHTRCGYSVLLMVGNFGGVRAVQRPRWSTSTISWWLGH